MKITFYAAALFILTAFLFSACEKPHVGGNSAGGLLPTNYISIKDSSFSPASLTVVSGSSITFVNTTSVPQRIISSDSLLIRDTTIAANKSYFFKNDTISQVIYHFSNKPAVGGVVNFTP
ncbi:MAG: hypothetical protein EOP54_18615 [Sphingobacteriales bacterium]|nr:MAG: hypothetical protein EOP54_18615 [Sphingobacteriales bacterium]